MVIARKVEIARERVHLGTGVLTLENSDEEVIVSGSLKANSLVSNGQTSTISHVVEHVSDRKTRLGKSGVRKGWRVVAGYGRDVTSLPYPVIYSCSIQANCVFESLQKPFTRERLGR